MPKPDVQWLAHTSLLHTYNRAETNIKLQSVLSIRKEKIVMGFKLLKDTSDLQSGSGSVETWFQLDHHYQHRSPSQHRLNDVVPCR